MSKMLQLKKKKNSAKPNPIDPQFTHRLVITVPKFASICFYNCASFAINLSLNVTSFSLMRLLSNFKLWVQSKNKEHEN